ncbi:hypothetical protein F7647_11060 [Tenacibaculum piscium]|uniref:hypothetical protein n=1 Tax=Tenacibaculum piscium TaxID=1458515 RepID=UPI00187B9C17|nr:hypothetical protein [Tenacibaculum piscium]MBE7686589.1 hypothetical protein [Tenacibaculum piscium]
MAVHIDKKGDLIITIPKTKGSSPLDELCLRRTAVYEALTEHDNKNYIGSDLHYGLVTILKDLDPTDEQWERILSPH